MVRQRYQQRVLQIPHIAPSTWSHNDSNSSSAEYFDRYALESVKSIQACSLCSPDWRMFQITVNNSILKLLRNLSRQLVFLIYTTSIERREKYVNMLNDSEEQNHHKIDTSF
jgi:hypothetical protein